MHHKARLVFLNFIENELHSREHGLDSLTLDLRQFSFLVGLGVFSLSVIDTCIVLVDERIKLYAFICTKWL